MKKIDVQAKERKSVTAVQALALLAISAGAIKSIQDKCIVSRIDTKKDLQNCYNRICFAINAWPESKRTVATTEEITEALAMWSKLEYVVTDRNRTAVLLAVCERALLDLYARLNTKLPRVLIRGILEPLQRTWQVEGKDGAMMSVHDESKVMITQLQNLIDW